MKPRYRITIRPDGNDEELQEWLFIHWDMDLFNPDIEIDDSKH